MAKVVENIVNEVENVMEENVEMVEQVEFVKLTLDEIKEKITVKNKIGVLAKQEMVQVIYNSCVTKDETNGIYYIDAIMREVAYNYAVLGNYTDFYSVVENAAAYEYDYLDEIGVFDYVSANLSNDIMSVRDAVCGFEARVIDLNSVGSCLYRIVGDGIKNMKNVDIGKFLKDIPKAINSIDKDVIKIVTSELKNGNVINMPNVNKKN